MNLDRIRKDCDKKLRDSAKKQNVTHQRYKNELTKQVNQMDSTYKRRNNDFYKAMNKAEVEKESKSESDDLQEISQLLHLNTNFEKNY